MNSHFNYFSFIEHKIVALTIIILAIESSCINAYMYMGCFQDIDPRDVNGFSEDNWGLTYQVGVDRCKSFNFKYAALQFGYIYVDNY